MLINNIDISTFKGYVQNKIYGHSVVKYNVEKTKVNITKIGEEIEGEPLKIEIRFEGVTRDQAHMNISNFLTHVKECDIKFKNITNTFKCYYNSHSIEETAISEYLILNIEFTYYEYGERVQENLINSNQIRIVNRGNLVAPLVMEITPKTSLVDLKIEGLESGPIIIKNLEMNKKIIIDGELGTVTKEGANEFQNVDLWDFPILSTGESVLSINKQNVEIKFLYNPRFL